MLCQQKTINDPFVVVVVVVLRDQKTHQLSRTFKLTQIAKEIPENFACATSPYSKVCSFSDAIRIKKQALGRALACS
jgi:hypothetical protein